MWFDKDEHYREMNHAEMIESMQCNQIGPLRRRALLNIHNDMYGTGANCQYCVPMIFENITHIFDRPARTSEEMRSETLRVTRKRGGGRVVGEVTREESQVED